jgi:Holliday junction resolvasome RuvABC ATP-dependent DNA helicase subunit
VPGVWLATQHGCRIRFFNLFGLYIGLIGQIRFSNSIKNVSQTQVLARKWRPRSFSELTGQEHVVKALTNALEQNRLHHAYLLTGTRGVGKTTIARILAKSLNCEAGVTANPVRHLPGMPAN